MAYVKALIILLTLIASAVQWSRLVIAFSVTSGGAPYERIDIESADRQKLAQEIRNGGDSLYVFVGNNMAGSTSFELDCSAYSHYGQLLENLGPGPVQPTHAIVYYMNLLVFTPDIVTCTVTWAGRSKTITVYDDNNMKLGYYFIQWSIDERGFSLYNTVSDNYDLYKTW